MGEGEKRKREKKKRKDGGTEGCHSWLFLVSPTGPESWGFLVLYQELSNNYQESCRNPPGIC